LAPKRHISANPRLIDQYPNVTGENIVPFCAECNKRKDKFFLDGGLTVVPVIKRNKVSVNIATIQPRL
jgi:hypothetical protein